MARPGAVDHSNDALTEETHWFWLLGSAVLHVIFVVGTISTLWSSHFRSWAKLSQRPSDALARALEDGRPVYFALVLVGAVLVGITAGRRLARGEVREVLIRFVVIAIFPIVIESTAFGVQDGSPDDLNLLPPHSILMLALLTLGPLALFALDLRALRRPPPDR